MLGRASFVVLTLLLCAACLFAQELQQKNSADSLMMQGQAALVEGRYAEAKASFEDAEKRAGVNAAEVNAGIGIAELQLGEYGAARQREERVLALVSKPHELAQAHDLIGTAWLREALETPAAQQQGKLSAAEKEFRRAVALDPLFDSAYFNLGTVLRQEAQGPQAAAPFRRSIEAASQNPASAVNLPLHPEGLAPGFTGKDSEAQIVSLGALRGRFILLDFWATWCPPGIHALPLMRQLATFFPGHELTVISLDEDSDNQAAWRSFIAQQDMNWTQIWDANSNIYYAMGEFGFAPRPRMVIPRYVFIDPEGFVLRVYTGTDRVGAMAGEIVRTIRAHGSIQRSSY